MLAAMAMVTGCATSDLHLVGNAKAAEIWNAQRYQSSCVGTGKPPVWCTMLRAADTAAEKDITAADAAQKVGALTASAKARMKAIPTELENLK